MRPQELIGASELAAEGAGGIACQARELHAGIAARVFASLELAGRACPPVAAVAAPVRAIHDGVAAAAWAAAGRGAAELIRAGGRAAALARPPDAPPLEQLPVGRVALGALAGAVGDRLAERRNPLAVQMSVRVRGEPVALEPLGLARAFPAATPCLAVFLHGLCETEDAWRLHAARWPPYDERLRRELGFTAVYVRYSSGLHISTNGRALAALLERLVAAWPVEVERIALVGHSMGGLVARSACHYGAGGEAVARVRDVFSLGSPHLGAGLERGAQRAAAALARLPETRALARALLARSAGIKDLGEGYLVDEDWRDYDPEAFLVARGREIPFLEHANHYFVAATVTRDPNAPLGRVLGDLLVSRASAWGQRRCERVRFPVSNYAHVGPATHFDLLNHPAIAAQLIRWLGERGRCLAEPEAA